MSETYDYFMVYSLNDSGERERLNINEDYFREDNGRNVLHPEQVVVIVKEDIRRIFIWKGSKSHVRKRFISSRVASALQEELVKEAAFHRCKIVSVDQGDEPREFLRAFNFKSMEVKEKLADMRYIRNIDREKMLDRGKIPDTSPKFVKVEKKEKKSVSPALKSLKKTTAPGDTTPAPTPNASHKATQISKKVSPKSSEPIKSASSPPNNSAPRNVVPLNAIMGISEEKKKSIMKKILDTKVPQGYKRQNLILGHTLYGAVTKRVNVFGKSIEEIDWDRVQKVPEGSIEIDNRKLRVYFDPEKGMVEALEILEKTESSTLDTEKSKEAPQNEQNKPEEKEKIISEVDDSWTVKELRSFAEEKEIDVPSSALKAEIIEIINVSIDSNNNNNKEKSKNAKKRSLPKIPTGDD